MLQYRTYGNSQVELLSWTGRKHYNITKLLHISQINQIMLIQLKQLTKIC